MYALGLLLFELVTGNSARAKYREDSKREGVAKAFAIGERLEVDSFAVPLNQVPDRALRRVIDRATRVKCSERYRTYDDFLSDLMILADMPSKLSEAKRAELMKSYTLSS